MTTQQPAPPGTTLLTVGEAGAELRLSRATAYRLIEEGRLAVVYVGAGKGKAKRVPRASIEAYIQAQLDGAGEQAS